MPDEGILLDGNLIRAYLREVADALGLGGPPCVLVVVGGSLLAMHELRDATRDVDSIRRLDEEVRAAAAEVARRHGLPSTWLNDNAAAWWPAGLTEGMCARELQHGRLVVLTPPMKYVFVMKLEANRVADQPDLRRLWPHTGFSTADDAADLWHSAYPQNEPDPHLAAYIWHLVSPSEERTGEPEA